MIREISVLLLLAVVACGPARSAPPDEVLARIASVTGSVQIHRVGAQRPEEARQGAVLRRGDRIEARPGADAGLIVGTSTRNLSARPGLRWTAGEPFEPAAKPLLEGLREKVLGKPGTSSPGGAEFAANPAREPREGILGSYSGGYQGGHGRRPAAAKSDPILAPPVVAASIDRDTFRRVVAEHREQVTSCYLGALRVRPGLAGRVAVEITVAASGRVTRARVTSSTVNSPVLEQCLIQRIQTWKFPAQPGGGVSIVNYPFEFRP